MRMSDSAELLRVEQNKFDAIPAIAIVWFGEFVMDDELPERVYTVVNRWGNA